MRLDLLVNICTEGIAVFLSLSFQVQSVYLLYVSIYVCMHDVLATCEMLKTSETVAATLEALNLHLSLCAT